jgi:SAM-dependent methyltransferase
VGERSDVSPDGDHAAIFAVQYTEASGPGSALSVTVPYRAFLEEFIRERGVASIVDLGCGDLEIMSHVDLAGARYLGVDVIAERVRRNGKKLEGRPQFTFNVGDARALPMGNLANFDLLIIKDVLQHWTNTEVAAWLARWQFAVQGPRYALVTNCNYGPTVNRDVAAGGWRAIDLTRAPFGVGKVVLRWALPRGPHVDYKDVVLLERA